MFTVFFQNKHLRILYDEKEEASPSEIVPVAKAAPAIEPTPEEKRLKDQADKQARIDEKSTKLQAVQEKTVESARDLEKIANDRVKVILKSEGFYRGESDQIRESHARDIVNAYIAEYTPIHADMAKNLKEQKDPILTPEQISEQLAQIDAKNFGEFVEKKLREYYVGKRLNSYEKLLPEDKRTEDNLKKVRDFFNWENFDYKKVRNQILEDRPDLKDDPIGLQRMLDVMLYKEFFFYCQKNDIPIDPSTASIEHGFSIEGDDLSHAREITIPQSEKDIFTTIETYQQSAFDLRQSHIDLQEEFPKEQWEREYSIPSEEILDSLPIGGSTSFVESGSGGSTLYYAEREPDGEYTISFRGMTLKNLPKKEVDVIVDLNEIPIISMLFSTNSTLYRTLLREYKFLCMLWGADPLENPPLGFIDFLYRRLNDAYMSTNPENGDTSLIGINISHLWYKDRGKYIRDVLQTNIEMRNQAMKRLQDQKIIISGKINLANFPR